METRFRLKAIQSDNLHKINQSPILIGRSQQCEISIDSGLLSRHHASISIVDINTILLKDLGSTNGTFINSMRVLFPTILKHRDVITIGDEKFIFVDSDLTTNLSIVAYGFSKSRDYFDDDHSNKTVIQPRASEDSFSAIVNLKPRHTEESDSPTKVVLNALSKSPLDANLTPAVFIILSGSRRGGLIQLRLPFGAERKWVLGRGELSDVVIEDPAVSSLHARVSWENGNWEIVDNKSTNGVRLNDKKISRSLLFSGDVVSLGKMKLAFRVL